MARILDQIIRIWGMMLYWLLPLAAHGWWCETSAVTGCVGHPRHFVLETSSADAFQKFEVFETVPVALDDQHLVVDWDKDGDLDIIKMPGTGKAMELYEQLDGHFVKKEPSPFKDVKASPSCAPAVVDWNGDGHLDMLVATSTGVKYYERTPIGGLEEKQGSNNPFQSIGGIHYCGHFSIADWDGDGHKEIFMTDLADSLLYFKQSNGRFEFVEANPFLKIQNRIKFRKPLMVDWNHDGLMDLVLVQQPLRLQWSQVFKDIEKPTGDTCKVLVFLQDDAGNLSELSEPNGVFENADCRYTNVALADVDGDHDLDAVLGTEMALHVYEHKSDHSLSLPKRQQAATFPVSHIKLSGHTHLLSTDPYIEDTQPLKEHYGGYRPYLADWDLDGDLDMAILSDSPVFHDYVRPRLFEHNADDSVTELDGSPNSSCPLNWSHPFSVADFDGDGQLDLVGMRGVDLLDLEVLVCLQTAEGYVVMKQERNPFAQMSNISSARPTFLDWDADGDVDLIYRDTKHRLHWVEQLQDGTLSHPQRLPVPENLDYVAADFDEDGDVDLVIALQNLASWKYYERREDGSLDQVLDNPFDNSLWQRVAPSIASASTLGAIGGLYSTLGDWNGDGAPDLIVLDGKRVSLLLNKPLQTFIEHTGVDNPFSDIHIAAPLQDSWNMVDVDGDGDLDFVYLPSGRRPVPATGEYKYFKQLKDGKLAQRDGSANPLQAAPTSLLSYFEWIFWKPEPQAFGMNHVVADVDGDGDVDIVHADHRGFMYAEQRNGTFTVLNGLDNPFHLGISNHFQHSSLDCWTLVDFDGDGDLDIVRTVPPNRSGYGLSQTSTEWQLVSLKAREVQYLEQASPRHFSASKSSFKLRSGNDNPFRSVDLSALPQEEGNLSFCPAVADVDNDGDLDLVLGRMSPVFGATFLYYEQENGTFKLAKNPFADIQNRMRSTEYLRFQLADWDGDGVVDLVASAGPSLHYFKQGKCIPASSPCDSLATCNKKTSKCVCSTSSRSQECRICSEYHSRKDSMCRSCPGFGTASGTCTRRGVCEDDADARHEQAAKNVTGFALDTATGAGLCNCSAPFYGEACQEGECQPGHRLDRNAEVEQLTKKYSQWEACVPCQEGRYKGVFGNQECDRCDLGLVPTANRSSCMPCPSGTTPHVNGSSCVRCRAGSVASLKAYQCTDCQAGEAPNAERSQCMRCGDGQVANPRSAQCTQCDIGTVPTLSKTSCIKCTGQQYALHGDEECRTCTFPAMILGIDNWCTSLHSVLFLVSFLILALIVAAVFGRFRLCCFKRRLRAMVDAKKWRELHMTQASPLEYGVWFPAAMATLEKQKEEVKNRSFQLGISLHFVFTELEAMYRQKAREAEWRQDIYGEATRSSYFVRKRNAGEEVQDEFKDAAWSALQVCPEPEDPNFHQVAGLLAYGPLALGKGQYCPRDGRPDCSIVDALEATSRSGRATWFLSWAWGYKFSTVSEALKRWWARHERVSRDSSGDVYIWWCVMVNNQFRMLEEGQEAVDASDLFDVFGRQLAGIGKMLMCLDSMTEGSYTTRIWCIFEVFVACQRSIPTTLILPKPDLKSSGNIKTLEELTTQCRVDAASAKASVENDAIKIKKKIMEDHESFDYVNQTVEKELCWEVIKYMEALEAQGDEGATSQLETTIPGVSELSTDQTSSDMVVRPQSQCHLQ